MTSEQKLFSGWTFVSHHLDLEEDEEKVRDFTFHLEQITVFADGGIKYADHTRTIPYYYFNPARIGFGTILNRGRERFHLTFGPDTEQDDFEPLSSIKWYDPQTNSSHDIVDSINMTVSIPSDVFEINGMRYTKHIDGYNPYVITSYGGMDLDRKAFTHFQNTTSIDLYNTLVYHLHPDTTKLIGEDLPNQAYFACDYKGRGNQNIAPAGEVIYAFIGESKRGRKSNIIEVHDLRVKTGAIIHGACGQIMTNNLRQLNENAILGVSLRSIRGATNVVDSLCVEAFDTRNMDTYVIVKNHRINKSFTKSTKMHMSD